MNQEQFDTLFSAVTKGVTSTVINKEYMTTLIDENDDSHTTVLKVMVEYTNQLVHRTVSEMIAQSDSENN